MRDEAAGPRGPAIVDRAQRWRDRVAVRADGRSTRYADLLAASRDGAARLLGGDEDLAGRRVAFLTDPDLGYVVTQWSIWRAGGVAVPLGTALPAPELRYVLEDAGVTQVVADTTHVDRVTPLAASADIPLHTVDDLTTPDVDAIERGGRPLPAVADDRAAMMLYTSGTTGRPKGVLHTHASLEAQCATLTDAWRWTSDDHALLVLPLHHTHGIVNVLGCALWNGAVCEMAGGFDARHVWERLASGDVTVFMAVPTIYRRLIAAWESADATQRDRWSAGASELRLMVSGSAALPVPTLERWHGITGHVLLERYGMTEIGMALSNTLDRREPGHVGWPLPSVDVRLVDDDHHDVPAGTPGQILVRGPAVFREYWQRPDATADAFVDGWFLTGDVAVAEPAGYRILGRSSVDIIKTGGEKVSALEIEDVLRTHPHIDECAVIGVPDEEWGERVAAAVVPLDQARLTLDELRTWCKDRLATYKVPTILELVDELPRNALGKVIKPALRPRLTEAGRAS